MNDIPLPLYPFPLTFQPVPEASCRPPSPLPNPGTFASHVGGTGNGDCQLLADIPCNVVGGGPVSPSCEHGVADQSVARTQSPEAVARMALASDVVVVDAHGSFTDNGSKEDCTVLGKGRAATVCEGNAAWVSIGKFMNPVLFDVCRCEPCSQRSRSHG